MRQSKVKRFTIEYNFGPDSGVIKAESFIRINTDHYYVLKSYQKKGKKYIHIELRE